MGYDRGGEYKLPVTLEDIYVVDLKASKTGFNGVEDVLTCPRVRVYWAKNPYS